MGAIGLRDLRMAEATDIDIIPWYPLGNILLSKVRDKSLLSPLILYSIAPGQDRVKYTNIIYSILG